MSVRAKTRILYVNHTGLVSGAEKVLIEILRGLNRDRFELFVVCPAKGGLTEAVESLAVASQSIPAPNARFSLRPDRALSASAALIKTAKILRSKIRAIQPDVIHANSIRAGIMATLAARGTRIPVVWHVHDTLPKHPLSSIVRAFALLSSNTRFIAVSHSTANHFAGRLDFGARLVAIHNGVDLGLFPRNRPDHSGFRQRLGLSNKDFLVCAIGQICARKGLLELIDALARIKNQAPSIRAAIVGKVVFQHEHDYYATLRNAVDRAGLADRVHFTGELSDVSEVLQATDLLVLNSHDEPFGLVLIEAMASGTPVLASRVGGIPEIVTDSENGWLVDKEDTAALASKLLELSQAGNLLQEIAQRGLQTVRTKFPIEKFRQEIERFYGKLEVDLTRKADPGKSTALIRSANH